MSESFLNDRVELHCGDCRDVLATLAENSIDACVTDPPYHLTSIVQRFGSEAGAAFARMSRGFMGKVWDGGDVAFRPETWAAVYRVLKPGAHLVAFGGTRTFHRLACAIEDAGFEIRDTVSWLYGSGFPKSYDVSKGIDRAAGAEREIIGPHPFANRGTAQSEQAVNLSGSPEREQFLYAPATVLARQWAGWGTALKPACELIVLARKPLSESTVAANVLRWGTGAINVDGCRVESGEAWASSGALSGGNSVHDYGDGLNNSGRSQSNINGRWPANVVHDGSDEVVAAFPESDGAQGIVAGSEPSETGQNGIYGRYARVASMAPRGDSGSAARFFFQAKQDDPCHSIKSASDAVENFALKSEHVVSALSHAVAITTERLALEPASYRAPDMNVSVQQFALIVASVTEAIQNIERRFSLGLPLESITARLGHAICVAIPNQIGITTITASLSTFDPSAEAVTFNITETSLEVGAPGFAKRFHYTNKADADDRLGSKHPTVKPLDLMQWLVRLVTPPRGTVLDPFSGTGTTGEAAWREGMRAVLIEAEPEYQADIRRRMKLCLAGPDERARESIKAKNLPRDDGPLFGGMQEAAE